MMLSPDMSHVMGLVYAHPLPASNNEQKQRITSALDNVTELYRYSVFGKSLTGTDMLHAVSQVAAHVEHIQKLE